MADAGAASHDAEFIDAWATAGCRAGPNSSSIELPTPSVITPPHTEQRARMPNSGIFAGSTL
jgi:hypothetical protein